MKDHQGWKDVSIFPSPAYFRITYLTNMSDKITENYLQHLEERIDDNLDELKSLMEEYYSYPDPKKTDAFKHKLAWLEDIIK